MVDVTISGAGAHASAAATDRIPASKAGVKGYLTADQIAAYVEGRTSLAELIRDTIGTALVAGTGVTVTVNDAGDTITLDSTITQYTDEAARDAIGAALVAGAGITVTVNDAGDSITLASSITQYTDEMARDAIGAALVAGTNITLTVNDAGDTITIAASGGGGGSVSDTAYANSWDGVTTDAPSKNAVYDKFEAHKAPIAPISGNFIVPTEAGGLANGNALNTNTIYWVPFTIYRRISISDIGGHVSTLSAAGNFQRAIYASSSSTGLPTGSELGKTGAMSTGSVAAVTGTLGGNITLDPGLYWAGLNQDNSTAAYVSMGVGLGINELARIIGASTAAGVIVNGQSTAFYLTSSKTYGTWGDVTSDSFTKVLTSVKAPCLILKVA